MTLNKTSYQYKQINKIQKVLYNTDFLKFDII